ncbi:pyrroloquinoline quinone biosynthesis peptide chaperone PqqD [Streptomyces sp. NPDC102360]|uniref:pyrroloquinoline quinone biosynthesis peptide chaperone PqqD n=1 Tax=Streptomyces sp. NPDC102360 TaxID=3366160 RepID=UPI003825A116
MTGGTWHPSLPPGALLRHDRARGTDVLLLPERVVVLHGSARSVLDLCDGQRSVDDIAQLLVQRHPEQARIADISQFLRRLHAQGCLQ